MYLQKIPDDKPLNNVCCMQQWETLTRGFEMFSVPVDGVEFINELTYQSISRTPEEKQSTHNECMHQLDSLSRNFVVILAIIVK